MSFVRVSAAAASLIWASFAAAQQSPGGTPELVSFTVADAPAENGKRLNATFQELKREQDYSVVQATVRSGGSVSSSMFVLRGACLVMRARGAGYFSSSPEPGGSARTYRLTFPTQPTQEQLSGRAKSVFAAAECELLGLK